LIPGSPNGNFFTMKDLSVLIVGKKGILNWQEDLKDAFLRLGCRCGLFHINPESVFEWIEKKKTGATPFLSEAFQKRFQEAVKKRSPKLILFLGMMVLPRDVIEFFDSITPEDTVKAAWMPDCVDKAPYADCGLFDIVFYFDTYLKPVLLKTYGDTANIFYLPLAVNEKQYFDQNRNRSARMLFAGTCTENRLRLLNALEHKIPLDIVGPGSKTLLGKRFGARLSSDKLNALFNQYEAALNINQKPNTMNGLNLRPFEAAAAGNWVFNENVPDLPRLFEPDKEVMVYDSAETLVEKFVKISKDIPQKNEIMKAGRRRVLAEHTFVHRARFILRHLGF
jgi:spore maturation protein CgeB